MHAARRLLNAKDQQWQRRTAENADAARVAFARHELDQALEQLSAIEGEMRAGTPRYAELAAQRF